VPEKTRVALAVLARRPRSTLCVAPTRVLVSQWQEALRAQYRGEVGVLSDGTRRLAPITVATLASALRCAPQVGHCFDRVVVDEAHHIGFNVYDDLMRMLVAEERLGLTATPPGDDAARQRLGDLIGPVVYRCTVDDLAGRYLAPYQQVPLFLPLSSRERSRYAQEVQIFNRVYRTFAMHHPGAEWPAFVRVAGRSEEGLRALAALRRSRALLAYTEAKRRVLGDLLLRHVGSRVLVFTASSAAAYAVARDHLVMPITCHIGRRERQLALERFRRGQLRVLVSARVLNEGIDVPDAEVAIVVGSSLGMREHIQRVGRVLRPAPGKQALVYELITEESSEVRQARRRQHGLVAH
jgi:superfamily II DNA or RNA helicase